MRGLTAAMEWRAVSSTETLIYAGDRLRSIKEF